MEEEAEKKKMEEMIQKAKGIKNLNKIAKRALQGKPKVYLLHWKRVVDLEILGEQKVATRLIQRVYRGFKGRKRAKKEITGTGKTETKPG